MSRGSVKHADRLNVVIAKHAYLDLKEHFLHESILEVRTAIRSGDGDPDDLLDRIEFEIDTEEKTLAAAFKRFDHAGKGWLDRGDMKHMSAYLGFPHTDDDINKLMKAIDLDGTGRISFSEFGKYVGRMGGSINLFEERRKRIAEKGGFAEGDPEYLKLALKEAGIDDESQAFWRLIVSPSEFREAERLVACQKKALAHIRRLAKKNHEDALPKVQKRVLGMGFKDEHLWMTLAWIRELAPVIIHLNLDKMLQFMESDTHYRNQFETATSGGLLKPEVRKKWERDLFGGCYDSAKAFERCKYGVLNVMNDYRGVVKCAQYGDSYAILKDARLRCTFSPEDSANLKADRLAVLDFYAHVLHEYSDQELKETINVSNSREKASLGDSSKVGAMKYKEAQIHGEVKWASHVERLVVNVKYRAAGKGDHIKAICKKNGWEFSWMDEEQARMKAEDQHKMAGATWEDRLAKLEASGLSIEVPEGFCKVGCGRMVHPGKTRSGKPFVTCCKGCIMGFGHDSECGQIDPSLVGAGMCKMGCGKQIADGRDSKGRPLDTCCRGCALHMPHDETCGKEKAKPAEGMCSKGCGWPVAPGTAPNGRPWNTCCRGCARGKGHSQECPGARASVGGTRSGSIKAAKEETPPLPPPPESGPVVVSAVVSSSEQPGGAPQGAQSCCSIT